ncbi:RNA polymerase sigma factor SigF [Mycolicibacterium vanbaalenii]|uniref:RNA polymerase sigma factor SigF n=1 Tax=Mycolicibacterium vanbaalenii TaxID=110539 RepID=A0A5S9P0U4_MYCVN|nr:SigB/SigF/SigG family RNA polymerase sigma factor [Mycolicibacterium vanbaalenii]CAA0096573.1 RNA polymerase sigma factor SigF [Mycolicibacterium vanbaalenii]
MDVAELTCADTGDSGARDPDWSAVEDLFERLGSCSTAGEHRRCRQRIITECLPLADHIAYRFVGRGEPSDDLIQVARIGLVKSVDRYVPAKGRFMAFAVPTIRGEVRRHFRDGTWSMRVPRKVQETQLKMRHAVETLSQRLNRSPTNPELARELGVDDDDVAHSHAAHWAYRPLSLDAPRSPDDGSQPVGIGASHGAEDPGYETVENLMMLREAIAELDPRRRDILGMRFFEGLTQREIALRLGISQVQVSRLLDATLTRLREQMHVDVAAPVAEAA